MTNIVAIQMSSSQYVDKNLDFIEGVLLNINQSLVDIVVLPECFAIMHDNVEQLIKSAESYKDGKIQKHISKLAAKYNTYIVAGSIPIKSEEKNKIYNSSLVYQPDGECIARYDKIHLFDCEVSNQESYSESEYTSAGNEAVIVKTPHGIIGLSICYDLRFPELYRELSARGAEIIVVPAAFTTTTGIAHWHTLLRARAIENHAFLIASAQSGYHDNGRKTFGHSIIINPWGDVIAEKNSGTGYITAKISLSEVTETRKKMPCLNHRRTNIFKTTIQPKKKYV